MGKYTLDWTEYVNRARMAAAEGCVLLKNDRQALPLCEGESCAVFGRIQNYYYKSGTGSGGMVNTNYVYGILEGLQQSETIKVDEELVQIYKDWEKKSPVDKGKGWGQEPWCQKEMPLDEELVQACAKRNDAAVVIIGRTAGEDQDNNANEGSYYLTEGERQMLSVVCRFFTRTIVVLNVGNTIDMKWVKEYDPAAVLYAWQGGMEGGMGAAAVLTGAVSPSGHLTDTIAENLEDYPSDTNFYEGDSLIYQEDIYVGYRYFETAAKDKVLYPFGFGLSYTEFQISSSVKEEGDQILVQGRVENIGAFAGKEVVQVYVSAPQGNLGKPEKVLAGFTKTKELKPGEAEDFCICISKKTFASYDDSGVSGYAYCYVLEEGTYAFYVGENVRDCAFSGSYEEKETRPVECLSQKMAPVVPFRRMKPQIAADGSAAMIMEDVPVRKEKVLTPVAQCLPYSKDQGWKLLDVYEGRIDLDTFIAQIPDKELCCMVRGEGMSSPRVTPGTAAAFGGVSDGLTAFGIPAACCTDGPSGMRLDSGTNAFSLPNGTLLACTFNRELIEDLFEMEGLEMRNNRIDTLLGPGMNIHRHPLNGRNFEYFSEDPLVSGQIAAAQLRGMAKAGVTGTIKHFCGNNREFHRRLIDSVISERALREIYLKGFEIAVKEGGAYSVMTTYGAVNGLYTAGCEDQNTAILRGEWGFDGIVMTDWWAEVNREEGGNGTREYLASMVAAQNDIYMVTREAAANEDDLETALAEGKLTRAQLVRSAKNILKFILRSPVMERAAGKEEKVELINTPADQTLTTDFDVIYHRVVGPTVIKLDQYHCSGGDSFMFGINTRVMGMMRLSLTASSDFDDLAQMTVAISVDNQIFGTYTFQGSKGKEITIAREKDTFGFHHYIKVYVAQSGLTLKSMLVEMLEEQQ